MNTLAEVGERCLRQLLFPLKHVQTHVQPDEFNCAIFRRTLHQNEKTM